MTKPLANGNHSEHCPSCGDFVAKTRIEEGGPLKRINCHNCGWGVEYDR